MLPILRAQAASNGLSRLSPPLLSVSYCSEGGMSRGAGDTFKADLKLFVEGVSSSVRSAAFCLEANWFLV